MPAREIAALYNSPKPRQEWVDGQFIQNSEDEEAWVELFIDLVYVVLLSKIGDLMETCMHEDPFYGFKLAVIFAVMCLARQSIDEYANRFYSHDLAHKLIYLVYTLGIFIQVSGSAGTKVMCKVSEHVLMCACVFTNRC
jgi:low temperature requirement protein LtrA